MSAAGPCRTRRDCRLFARPSADACCCGPCPRSPGAGWSKTRLGFAVFGGPSTGVVQNASQFDGFGRIQAISGRLRRILDQVSGKTPDPPETQTHFGPPSRWTIRLLGHQAVVPQGPLPTGLSGRLGDHQALWERSKAAAPPGSWGSWAADSASFPPAGTLPGCVCGSGKRTGPGRALQCGFPSRGASPWDLDPHIEKAPVPSNHINGTGAFGALAPPTRSPERRRRRPPGRPRPASSPAPRGRARWRRRRTAGSCRPCAAPGNPSSSPRPSCPG